MPASDSSDQVPEHYRSSKHWLDWYRSEFHRRAGGLFDDPEDACETAIERFLFNKLPSLRIRPGARNLDALVKTVYRITVTDLVRERFGRARVPAKMRALGPPTSEIFIEYLKGQSAEDIANTLALPIETVKRWITWLEVNNKVPSKIKVTHIMGDELDVETFASGMHDDVTFELSSTDDVAALSEFLFGINSQHSEEEARELFGERARLVSSLREQLALSDEERMLLRLKYVEAMTSKEISARLDVPLHRIRKRETVLLERIRAVFADSSNRLVDSDQGSL